MEAQADPSLLLAQTGFVNFFVSWLVSGSSRPIRARATSLQCSVIHISLQSLLTACSQQQLGNVTLHRCIDLQVHPSINSYLTSFYCLVVICYLVSRILGSIAEKLNAKMCFCLVQFLFGALKYRSYASRHAQPLRAFYICSFKT